jgi:hypothetical protein
MVLTHLRVSPNNACELVLCLYFTTNFNSCKSLKAKNAPHLNPLTPSDGGRGDKEARIFVVYLFRKNRANFACEENIVKKSFKTVKK